jgi:hypothetical protein
MTLRRGVWGAVARRFGRVASGPPCPGRRNVGLCAATTGQPSRRSRKPAAAGAGRAGKEGCAGCYWLIR